MHSYMGLNLVDYLTPKELIRTQLNTAPVLLRATGQLISHSHPNFGTTLFLIIVASVFMLVFKTMKKLIDKRRLKLVIGFVFAVILLMNIKIFLAHLNKPSYDFDKTKFITEEELQEFFTNQANECKIKYLKKKDGIPASMPALK
jgi:hypothetical protein